MIRFGRYKLDATEGLRRGTQEVRLTPKSLAVLVYLAERAGRTVSKDELFAAIWSETAVTDSALATCIQEIRRALDDDARQPRFLETIHRRGYRFIAATSARAVPRPVATGSVAEGALVGRDASIAAVMAAFERAHGGAREICLISGEPGIGKSTVLAACLDRMAAAGARTALGRCIEHYGSGEPYEPLLDALMRLCRGPDGEATIGVLEQYAPMWLAQLPGLLGPRQAARLQRSVAGAARDRMIRELVNAVETLAADIPLVIAIEDLHWSDPSTLDWLAAVAPRQERAKLVILATLRPSGVDTADTPLGAVRDALRVKRLGTEVVLGGLDEAAVSRYVLERLPPAAGRRQRLEAIGARLTRHTGGNPLFVASVLDQLIDRGIVTATEDGWSASADVELIDLGIPATIRPLIDRQIAGLAPDGRAHLETASVVGERFSIAIVSRVDGIDERDVEAVLAAPGMHGLVRSVSTSAAGDEQAEPELRFVHTLYRDALYEAIPAARRTRLHRLVGAELERARGEQAVSAEVALHFERGDDEERAIEHLGRAAETARRLGAFREARAHYERALTLLARFPDDDARAALELPLRMGLGGAIMALSGFGAPGVEASYMRARALTLRVPDAPGRFPASWGLWLFYWGRGEVRTAAELVGELEGIAEHADDGTRLQALHASWATAFSQGRLAGCLAAAGSGLGLYDRERHAAMAATFGSHDAGVCASMFAARALVLAGRDHDAIRAADDALELAAALDHPFSLALALTFRAAVDQSRVDPVAAERHAKAAVAIAEEHGFGLMHAWCTTIAGWAAVRGAGRTDPFAARAGLEAIARGIAAARATGSKQFQPYLLGMEADACLATGLTGRGQASAAEGLSAARTTGERFHESELLRLQAELLAASVGPSDEAEDALRSAIDLARGQGAAALALRAATRLARLGVSDPADRLQLLRKVFDAMPADAAGIDAREAAALIRD